MSSVVHVILWVQIMVLINGAEEVDQELAKRLDYWFNLKPDKKERPISPMAGRSYVYRTQSFHIELQVKDPGIYSCYSCSECNLDDEDTYRIIKQCKECAIIIRRPQMPKRLCNRGNFTFCRERPEARCCQADLCNRAKFSGPSRMMLLSFSVCFLPLNILYFGV
ncbi:unnamed protein product [Calicophoron daubneyi]|uniref:Uncharacterized protein n=1 Tax=Calicophoron daubneyi TaxID=300641 RepID=A0AAV2TF60_CALDB